jgi:hypothetical protein
MDLRLLYWRPTVHAELVFLVLADSVSRDLILGKNVETQPQYKYAGVERERRFLLERFPSHVKVVRILGITDSYIDGTTLRLRQQNEDNAPTIFKLTQKVPAQANGAQEGLTTSMYLTQDKFCVLAQLPAK